MFSQKKYFWVFRQLNISFTIYIAETKVIKDKIVFSKIVLTHCELHTEKKRIISHANCLYCKKSHVSAIWIALLYFQALSQNNVTLSALPILGYMLFS